MSAVIWSRGDRLRSHNASFCRPFRAHHFCGWIQGRREARPPLATFCRASGARPIALPRLRRSSHCHWARTAQMKIPNSRTPVGVTSELGKPPFRSCKIFTGKRPHQPPKETIHIRSGTLMPSVASASVSLFLVTSAAAISTARLALSSSTKIRCRW